MVSIIIPAKSEPYLQKTINDIFAKARGDVEVIVILDGYWPNETLEDNSRLHVIHFSGTKGMRPAINAGANMAKGKYLIKCDAHCAFQPGFDVKLVRDHQPDWVLVPVRYDLNVDTWERGTSIHEFQYIEQGTLKGRNWPEYKAEGRIVPLMTTQGSFWFMERAMFFDIGGLDDVNYGVMGREAQEVCLKVWTSGGKFMLDRNVWYAHWDKPKEWVIGGMKEEKKKSERYAVSYWTLDKLQPVISMFAPVPTWSTGGTNKGLSRAGLYEMFAKRGYKEGVEVGVWDGVNASVMFNKIPNLHLYLVDPYIDYSLGRRMRGEERLDTAWNRAHRALAHKNCVFIREMSEIAVQNFEDESLDFVYIDGNHKYDFAMLDIIFWERKVRKGGIVSGHDYYNDWNHNVGVKKAVDDYVSAYKEIHLQITDYMAEPHGKNAKASWFWEKR